MRVIASKDLIDLICERVMTVDEMDFSFLDAVYALHACLMNKQSSHERTISSR